VGRRQALVARLYRQLDEHRIDVVLASPKPDTPWPQAASARQKAVKRARMSARRF
jgi:hypothetical protein